MIKLKDILKEVLNEADPKVGTGKKPKGSGRRLYIQMKILVIR